MVALIRCAYRLNATLLHYDNISIVTPERWLYTELQDARQNAIVRCKPDVSECPQSQEHEQRMESTATGM